MSSIDIRMDQLRDGLSNWGKETGRKPGGHQGSVEVEQAKLSYGTASDSFAKLEVRHHLSALISRFWKLLCAAASHTVDMQSGSGLWQVADTKL